MRILIFGAGAIGSVLATMLSPLHDVDVAVRGEHARRILEEGLIIRGAVERSAHPGTEPRGRYDMIFITTKAYDVEQASRSAEAFSGDETTIVSPQNGLRHVGVLTERFGDRVVLSPTTMGATRIGQVEVRLAAMGTTVVGSMHGDPGRAEKVAAVLNEAGVRSEVSDNIIGEVWTKAIVNACINPPSLACRSSQRCLAGAQAASRHRGAGLFRGRGGRHGMRGCAHPPRRLFMGQGCHAIHEGKPLQHAAGHRGWQTHGDR